MLESFIDRTLGTGQLRRVAGVSAWLLLIAGVVFILGFGLPHLTQRRAESLHQSPVHVQIESAPAWFTATPGLAEHITARVAETAGNAPTDRAALMRAHAVLEKTGWFKDVERLHREPDGAIRVVGTMVTPFAVVRWGANDHLIDTEGNLLDYRFEQGEANPNLPLIAGAQAPPPMTELGEPNYGSSWAETADMKAGMSLLHLLHTKPWFTDINAVDIGAYEQSGCLWIQCDGGTRICWGLGPDEISAAELTPSEKIRLVDSIYALYGPLHSLSPTEIDVRHDLATVSTTSVNASGPAFE